MLERIIEIIRDELSMSASEVITETTVLREDLEADSLNMVEIIMALEDEFGIEFPEDDLDGIKTVSDLEKYILERVS